MVGVFEAVTTPALPHELDVASRAFLVVGPVFHNTLALETPARAVAVYTRLTHLAQDVWPDHIAIAVVY